MSPMREALQAAADKEIRSTIAKAAVSVKLGLLGDALRAIEAADSLRLRVHRAMDVLEQLEMSAPKEYLGEYYLGETTE